MFFKIGIIIAVSLIIIGLLVPCIVECISVSKLINDDKERKSNRKNKK